MPLVPFPLHTHQGLPPSQPSGNPSMLRTKGMSSALLVSLFSPVIPPYLLPSLLPPSRSLLAPLMVTFSQSTIGLGAATQGWAFGASLVVSGCGLSCWSQKAPGQRKLGVCRNKTILSPLLPPWATPYLSAGLRSRVLLRHLKVKSRKRWQLKRAWFDREEGFPTAPPPAPADPRLEDLGPVCIHSPVCLYVEVMDLYVWGVSNEGVFVWLYVCVCVFECVCVCSLYVSLGCVVVCVCLCVQNSG